MNGVVEAKSIPAPGNRDKHLPLGVVPLYSVTSEFFVDYMESG